MNWTSRATAIRVSACLLQGTAAALCSASSPSEAFDAENRAAMQRMMDAMHVASSGDVDRDFARMMIPHHQGAIDMAHAELRFGKDTQLRRLAQAIIVDQQQEIAVMRHRLSALGDAP